MLTLAIFKYGYFLLHFQSFSRHLMQSGALSPVYTTTSAGEFKTKTSDKNQILCC